MLTVPLCLAIYSAKLKQFGGLISIMYTTCFCKHNAQQAKCTVATLANLATFVPLASPTFVGLVHGVDRHV